MRLLNILGLFVTGLAALIMAENAHAEHRWDEDEFTNNVAWSMVDEIGHNYQGCVLYATDLYNTFREANGEAPYDFINDTKKTKEIIFRKEDCGSEGCKYVFRDDLFTESQLSSIDLNPKDHKITNQEINQYRADHGLGPIKF